MCWSKITRNRLKYESWLFVTSVLRVISRKLLKLWGFVISCLKKMWPKYWGKLFSNFCGCAGQKSTEIDLDMKVDFLSCLSCNWFRQKMLKLWWFVVIYLKKMWLQYCAKLFSSFCGDAVHKSPESTYQLVFSRQKLEGSNPSKVALSNFWAKSAEICSIDSATKRSETYTIDFL